MQVDPRDAASVQRMSEKTYSAISQLTVQLAEFFIASAREPVKLALAANIAGIYRALVHSIHFLRVVQGKITACSPDQVERNRERMTAVSEDIASMTARMLEDVDPTHQYSVAIVRREKPLAD